MKLDESKGLEVGLIVCFSEDLDKQTKAKTKTPSKIPDAAGCSVTDIRDLLRPRLTSGRLIDRRNLHIEQISLGNNLL